MRQRRRLRRQIIASLVPLAFLGVVLSVASQREARGVVLRGDEPPPELRPLPPFVPSGARRIDVGEGARSAAVFRPLQPPASSPVVIFLHGWAAVDPRRYGPWIDHLTRRGTTVVYPVYHVRPFNQTRTLLPDMLEAVQLALARFPAPMGRLIVAGHSAGGGLAADYAATASEAGLPVPAVVMSMYPARNIKGLRSLIPSAELRDVPKQTRMLVLYGERDTSVGDVAAKEIARAGVRAQLMLQQVTDDDIDDHSAPRRSDGPTRRTFWRWLDRLIDQTAR